MALEGSRWLAPFTLLPLRVLFFFFFFKSQKKPHININSFFFWIIEPCNCLCQLLLTNTSLRAPWPTSQCPYLKRWQPQKCKPHKATAMLPRLALSHCFLINAWRWLAYMIKDTWLSACLEAFQGLNRWKQLGFISNLITLWKSLVYKHICLTSNHSDLMLRSPGSVSYTHLTLPTTRLRCRSRWSPYH